MPSTSRREAPARKKTLSASKIGVWLVYILLALTPIILAITHHEVLKTAPLREATAKAADLAARAEYDKAHPWCTQVATYEVHDKTGAVVRTEKHEEQVRCTPDLQAAKAFDERMASQDRVLHVLAGVGVVIYFLLLMLGR